MVLLNHSSSVGLQFPRKQGPFTPFRFSGCLKNPRMHRRLLFRFSATRPQHHHHCHHHLRSHALNKLIMTTTTTATYTSQFHESLFPVYHDIPADVLQNRGSRKIIGTHDGNVHHIQFDCSGRDEYCEIIIFYKFL